MNTTDRRRKVAWAMQYVRLFGRACEKAIIEVREYVLEPRDAISDYWLGPCVGSPSEIPGAVKARMAQIVELRQQLEAQTFELNAAKAKLDEQARLHDMMTRDMMTDFMQSATQRECEELRTYNAGLGIERDALRAQLAALTAERGKLRDALEVYAYITTTSDGVPIAPDDGTIARAALTDAPDAE